MFRTSNCSPPGGVLYKQLTVFHHASLWGVWSLTGVLYKQLTVFHHASLWGVWSLTGVLYKQLTVFHHASLWGVWSLTGVLCKQLRVFHHASLWGVWSPTGVLYKQLNSISRRFFMRSVVANRSCVQAAYRISPCIIMSILVANTRPDSS